MSDISNFQEFTFLLLKRRWIQKLVFEDGGVQNISRMKIYRTTIIKKAPALKGEVDSKTTVFEDGGVFLA